MESWIIMEKTTGTRRIMGTDWPVKRILYRSGPRRWVVLLGVCMGAAMGAKKFRRKRDAIAYFLK